MTIGQSDKNKKCQLGIRRKVIRKNSSRERREWNERSDRSGAIILPKTRIPDQAWIEKYAGLRWILPTPVTSLTLRSRLLFLGDLCKQRERFGGLHFGENLTSRFSSRNLWFFKDNYHHLHMHGRHRPGSGPRLPRRRLRWRRPEWEWRVWFWWLSWWSSCGWGLWIAAGELPDNKIMAKRQLFATGEFYFLGKTFLKSE
jgi:hypothetical protein